MIARNDILCRIQAGKENMMREMPLYQKIKDTIREEIFSSYWPEGTTIYSERDICEKFKVSRITAIRVLDELERENYIRREKGRGNVLISSGEPQKNSTVCLILRTEDHFQPFLHHLLRCFEPTDYHIVLFPFSPFSERRMLEQRWKKILAARPGTYIVDAMREAPFYLFTEEIRNTSSLVFTMRYQWKEEIPAAYVLTDYAKGGLLTTEHAARCGYDNILCYTNPIDEWNRTQKARIDAVRQICKQRRKSFFLLERERNVGGTVKKNQDNTETITVLLKRIGKNTAVLCDYDYKCLVFLRIAENLGWNVPEDVGIFGYYNTPISEAYGITSVDVHPEEIARMTVEVLQQGTRNTILVAPEIVERGTTRRVDKCATEEGQVLLCFETGHISEERSKSQ